MEEKCVAGGENFSVIVGLDPTIIPKITDLYFKNKKTAFRQRSATRKQTFTSW